MDKFFNTLSTHPNRSQILKSICPIGFFLTDKKLIVTYANNKFFKILQISKKDVINKPLGILTETYTDRPLIWQALLGNGYYYGELLIKKPNKTDIVLNIKIDAIRDKSYGNITNFSGIITDITDGIRVAQCIAQNIDPITNLKTLDAFSKETNLHLRKNSKQKYPKKQAILFISITHRQDGLISQKDTNIIMRETANRLHQKGRNRDNFGRINDKSFLILLSDINYERYAVIAAQRIANDLSKKITTQKKTFYLNPIIGIAIYPNDGNNSEDLIRHAELASITAKNHGNTWRLFKEEMQKAAIRRIKIETGLREAINNNFQGFKLYAQAQLDLKVGQTNGVEILLRWSHPELGKINPAEFIPIAEEAGLIVEIGSWVLLTAAIEGKKFHDNGYPVVIVVNISGHQINHKNFIPFVEDVIRKTKISPGLLELEVTETVFIKNSDRAKEVLNQLHEMRIRTAIDDFGAQYSSLSQLKQLPALRIKIDGTFVRDADTSKEAANILTSIIEMISKLRRSIIVEGAETQAQMSIIEQTECNEVQGYFHAKPMPLHLIPNFLQNEQAQLHPN